MPAKRLGARERGRRIAAILRATYPDADTALHHESALELLVATVLSAQCTDERVNGVTPALFRAYPNARAYAEADPSRLEAAIKPTGFFRAKTRSLIGLGRNLVERFGGEVPRRMQDLVTLPGVGRKTANVLLGTIHGIPSMVVDTHVKRVSARLGLTRNEDPERIERDLWRAFADSDWTFVSHALIWHGRRICVARKPRCADCALQELCPSAAAFLKALKPRKSASGGRRY